MLYTNRLPDVRNAHTEFKGLLSYTKPYLRTEGFCLYTKSCFTITFYFTLSNFKYVCLPQVRKVLLLSVQSGPPRTLYIYDNVRLNSHTLQATCHTLLFLSWCQRLSYLTITLSIFSIKCHLLSGYCIPFTYMLPQRA